MEDKIKFDYMAKSLLVGDSGVGKSSLVGQLVNKECRSVHQPTLGLEFKFKRLDYLD